MTHKGPILPPPVDLGSAVARGHRSVSPAGRGAAPVQARMVPGPPRPARPDLADRLPPGCPPQVYGSARGVPVQQRIGAMTVGPPPLAWSGMRATAVQRAQSNEEPAQAGFANITFEKVPQRLVPDVGSKALKGWTAAVACLEKAIELLAGQKLGNLETLFVDMFICTSEEGGATVAQVLKDTLGGLRRNDITLNISAFNYASKGTKLTIAVAQMNDDNQRVRYIVHEATHMSAGTNDAAGYIGNDGKYKNGVPNSATALKNADSFACFVMGCSGIDLSPVPK